jgi:hypothetical protein
MRLPLRAQLPAPRSETDLQIDRFLDAMRGESTFEHNYPALLGFFASFRRVGVKRIFGYFSIAPVREAFQIWYQW